MSFQSRRELLAKVAPRYKEETRKQKSVILNEFTASTGYARKYAIHLLLHPKIPPAKTIKRQRLRFYGKVVQEALLVAWASANYIASKRLAPFLEELVPALERHGYLNLSEEVRTQLISISPATIDRILQPWRVNEKKRGISMTRSGKLLKNQIPVRTFADWKEKVPGFFEADLVAHCGWSMEGAFLYTIVLTDIATGWVECLPLLHRSSQSVIHAIDQVRKLIPFPILGLDTDNGSEFINHDMINYCEREEITFTRGRAYKKNDQCFVEQKNGVVVRQLVGYDRFEGQQAYRQMAELYRAVRLYINFFQPSMKLHHKKRQSAKVNRVYDTAKTPFQRLRTAEVLTTESLDKFDFINKALDPVRLLKQIESLQNALWQHALLEKITNRTVSRQIEVKTGLRFQESICFLPGGVKKNDIVIDVETRAKRKYRKTRKPKKPRCWRTRKDPFEKVWDEISVWLEKNPERTAKSLLLELQGRYPGKYSEGQLRSLQRRVKNWRTQAIITFNDEYLDQSLISGTALPYQLKAIIAEESDPSIAGAL